MTMQAVLLAYGGLRSLPPILSLSESSVDGKSKPNPIESFMLPPRSSVSVGQLQWPNSAIIRSEGSRRRRPQQSSVSSNKSREGGGGDELKRRSKSPDNDEILALFRRIQSSISKEGEAKVPRRRRRGIADSVSPDGNKSRESGKEQGRRRGSGLEGDAALENSKSPRPLSKFVRKSPIPVASPFEDQSLLKKEDEVENEQEVKEGEEKTAGSEVSAMQKIDEMKLSELKELARGEGIKGISRLKKGELLQLLKERLKSTS